MTPTQMTPTQSTLPQSPPPSTSPTRRSRRSGFSLIEILCAVVLLSVGLVGILEALTLSVRYSRDEEHLNTAIMLAASRLEEFRAEAYVLEGESDGDFAPDFPQWTWKQTIESSALSGLYDVRVDVNRDSEEEPLYSLQTQLFDTPLESPEEINERDNKRDSRRGAGSQR